jgi:hypothetical protein
MSLLGGKEPKSLLVKDVIWARLRGIAVAATTVIVSRSGPNSNGEGLYFENGGLYVGVHPSTLPDPYKPLKKSEEGEEHRKLLEAEVRERLERERMEQ